MLFLVDETPRLRGVDPSEGPFLSHPSPIASIAVADFHEGVEVVFDRTAKAAIASFPLPNGAQCNGLDQLNGKFRVQAVFDAASSVSTGHQRAGNLLSNVVEIELAADRVDRIELEWQTAIESVALPTVDGVEWIERKSEMLSKAAGRDVFHRAGVALPREYHKIDATRRQWPAVYAIPGHRDASADARRAALEFAPALQSEYLRTAFPQAVWICLDPNGPLGHHAFIDSAANGPVTQALVQEFIPYLEQRYRLVARPEARVLTGTGIGGFACLWLLLREQEVFSQAFVTAPEPVSMAHLGMLDLDRDTNAFTRALLDDAVEETTALRGILGPQDDRVFMSVREAIGMEHAMHPHGESGGRFDGWNAIFCSIDPSTGAPRQLIDPITGAIDPTAAVEYGQFDILAALHANPDRIGSLLSDRAHILVGARDSYFAERGIEALQTRLDAWRESAARKKGAGSIELLAQRDRHAVQTDARLRFGFAINDWFRSHGLADELPDFDPKHPFRTPGVDAPIPGTR